MTRYDLKGRIAVVTGATGAIGSAVVRALVEGGASSRGAAAASSACGAGSPTTRGWSCAPPT